MTAVVLVGLLSTPALLAGCALVDRVTARRRHIVGPFATAEDAALYLDMYRAGLLPERVS